MDQDTDLISKNLPFPNQQDVEQAIITLIKWAGDDPSREGLLGTPERVAKAWKEYCKGYLEDPETFLKRTFNEIEGYDEVIVLKDIKFVSHCEHHLAPIIGSAHVGYLPDKRVVGISKLARVVDSFAKRLQIQEKMTAQIADVIERILRPKGVAVIINAEHQCMSARGIQKPGVKMLTSRMLGEFRENSSTRREFLSMIGFSK